MNTTHTHLTRRIRSKLPPLLFRPSAVPPASLHVKAPKPVPQTPTQHVPIQQRTQSTQDPLLLMPSAVPPASLPLLPPSPPACASHAQGSHASSPAGGGSESLLVSQQGGSVGVDKVFAMGFHAQRSHPSTPVCMGEIVGGWIWGGGGGRGSWQVCGRCADISLLSKHTYNQRQQLRDVERSGAGIQPLYIATTQVKVVSTLTLHVHQHWLFTTHSVYLVDRSVVLCHTCPSP